MSNDTWVTWKWIKHALVKENCLYSPRASGGFPPGSSSCLRIFDLSLSRTHRIMFSVTFSEPNPEINACSKSQSHDGVIKWIHFPRYWPFVRGIHRSPGNSPHKSQWRGALMFTLICARINGWVNSCEAGDLRRNRAHYDVIVMLRNMPGKGVVIWAIALTSHYIAHCMFIFFISHSWNTALYSYAISLHNQIYLQR